MGAGSSNNKSTNSLPVLRSAADNNNAANKEVQPDGVRAHSAPDQQDRDFIEQVNDLEKELDSVISGTDSASISTPRNDVVTTVSATPTTTHMDSLSQEEQEELILNEWNASSSSGDNSSAYPSPTQCDSSAGRQSGPTELYPESYAVRMKKEKEKEKHILLVLDELPDIKRHHAEWDIATSAQSTKKTIHFDPDKFRAFNETSSDNQNQTNKTHDTGDKMDRDDNVVLTIEETNKCDLPGYDISEEKLMADIELDL